MALKFVKERIEVKSSVSDREKDDPIVTIFIISKKKIVTIFIYFFERREYIINMKKIKPNHGYKQLGRPGHQIREELQDKAYFATSWAIVLAALLQCLKQRTEIVPASTKTSARVFP